MQGMNALLPGEHDWLNGNTPSGTSMTPEPPKNRGGIMNALGAVFKYGAPEAYEQGRQRKATETMGNALAMGNYEDAAQTAFQSGNLDQGMQLRQYAQGQQAAGSEQETAMRQQQAEGKLSLFSQAPLDQITEFAMSEPTEFERITGIPADEYTQAGAMLRQSGRDPEEFRQFIVQKAKAELGQMPEAPEQYTLGENQVRYDEQGNVIARGMEKARDPINVNGVLVDPVTYEPVGNYQTPSQSGQMTDYQRQQLAIERQQAEQARAGRWQSAGDGVIFNTGTGDMQGGGGFDYGATGTFDANTGMGSSPFQTIEMYDSQGRVYQADFSGPAFGGGEEFTPPQPSGRKPTDFDKTQDREMAKDIADWKTTGQATALASLAKLREVISDLEDPNSSRGGAYMAMMPDGMKPLVAPNSVNAKETAESVVQSSLKAVLGGQFAQKEADQLFARTYNPVLGDEVNAKRLQRLYNEMVNRAAMNEAAARYADQYGTLQGFEGYLPQLQDFMLTDAETTTGSGDTFGSGGQRMRRSRGDGGGPQYEQTATNPQTGERMGLRNGQWEPIQ